MSHAHSQNASPPGSDVAGTNDIGGGVFGAFDENVGSQQPNQTQRGIGTEVADIVDCSQRRQYRRAIALLVDWSTRTFEAPGRTVTVEADNENVPGRTRACQQVDVSPMQDIEYTIRENDA